MDFGTLLTVAQKNEKKHVPKACYQTKFTPPKKENKQSKALSDNIKKFLARKEEEERQKALEEKKKRENLLALRDQKAQNRINKHLKVCKAANKAVLADAIDNENTAVTLAGPSQCDEDDYGYVSQEASAFYNKLMNKYNNLPPEKPLFSNDGKKTVKDIASTKDRVRQALKQQELEESLPHRRKRKHKELESDDKQIRENYDKCNDKERDDKERDRETEKEDKPKIKRKPMPPPIDFSSLMKLAEKKQHEPIKIEPKPKLKEEPQKLMTKKQMEEFAKEKERRERKEQRSRNPDSNNSKPVQFPNDINKSVSTKIPKLSSAKPATEVSHEKTIPKLPMITKNLSDKPADKSNVLNKSSEKNNVISKPKEKNNCANKYAEKSNGVTKTVEKLNGTHKNYSPKVSEKDAIAEERRKLEEEKRKLEEMRRSIEEEKKKLNMNKSKKVESKLNSSHSQKALENKVKDLKTSSSALSLKSGPSKAVSTNGVKSKPIPPSEIKPRQFPPADVKPRQFPPADVRTRQFPPPDVRMSKNKAKLKVNKRRIYDTDEEDYDSEMDDFIDDGPEEDSQDVSKYISEIFGYDKSKYRDVDDDDDAAMESNFAQQLKEEFVSTKIGMMEDLEDIRLEKALEKKKKALLMKKKSRKV